MLLLHALLELELVEHGSANPFVALVSAVEFRTSQMKGLPIDTSICKDSTISQLSNLLKILDSVKDWVVPESDIRKNLDIAVPIAETHINAAIDSVRSGNMIEVFKSLAAARDILVKHSHLKFEDVSSLGSKL